MTGIMKAQIDWLPLSLGGPEPPTSRSPSRTKALSPLPDMDFSCASFLVLRRTSGADDDICDAMRDAIRRAF